MNRNTRVVVLIVLAWALQGAPGWAKVVQKPQMTLNLPDGWVEIPQNILANVDKELRRRAPQAQIPRYDYGFQPASVKTWMGYPYILVQIDRSGKLLEADLKELPQLDANGLFRENADKMKSLISQTAFGKMQYDEAAGIIWTSAQTQVAGVGKVRGLSGMIPNETGFIAIHGYARERDFAQYAETFRSIIQSTSVTRPTSAPSNWASATSLASRIDWRVLANPLYLGAIVGAIAGCVGGLIGGIRCLVRGAD